MRSTADALRHRFGDFDAEIDSLEPDTARAWQLLANRGVCRRFKPEPVPVAIVDTLCALALSSPTKSDLQQRDILIVEDAAKRARINELLSEQDWLPAAPNFLIFLGNNRRQRQNPCLARQAVRQRSPRCLLQHWRRCSHCTVRLHIGGQCRRHRMLPDQHHP